MSKILPTIGPKTEKLKDIKKIISFSDFLRLNGSHNTLAWHEKISKIIKSINPTIKILFDLPGIKPRTANKSELEINLNDKIVFYFGKYPKKIDGIKVKITQPLPVTEKKIKHFSISDGKFLFHSKKKCKNYIIGKSLSKFTLLTRQGLNIPHSKYNEKKQLKIYLKFLAKCKKRIKFDAIGLSFVQTGMVTRLIKLKFRNLAIISKIENSERLKNLKSICQNSNGIMIDRGDLAAEIGDQKLFDSILEISKECNKQSIPLIMATENLGSMLTKNSPNKSEIVSLGFSNLLKIDRIMLSEETSISNNWKQTLKWLNKFLTSLENKQAHKTQVKKSDFFWEIFKSIKNIPVILFTKKGYAINNILNTNQDAEFFVFTDNNKVDTVSKLRSNVHSIMTDKFDNTNLNNFINKNIKRNIKLLFKNSSNAILIYVANPRKNSRANTLQFVSRRDYK
jgi:pyruvate kinase|tara:strand:+ start:708 stop:2063 length:1356 start_codon:yes stop_codon:yes gene_type:complete